jgi:hypothetical protein
MPSIQKLGANGGFSFEVSTQPDESLINHIKSTLLGSHGGIRYQLTRIERKMANIRKAYFVLLKRNEQLLGSIGFLKRPTYSKSKPYSSWYIRYFSIKAPMQSKVHRRKQMRDPGKGSNLLRDIALPYMENPGLLEGIGNPAGFKSLVYAYVEAHNFRSMNFSQQMGSETVRKFTTVIFSRFRPKKHAECRLVDESEYPVVLEKIKSFYAGYTLFTDENLFYEGNYHVYEENGQIVAGMQIHPEYWKILKMGGWFSNTMLHLLPWIPGVRGFFNPRKFRFLAVEGVFFLDGKEFALEKLLESACAYYKNNFAMTWMDTNSSIIKGMDRHVNYGLIAGLFERVEANVQVKFNGFSEEEKKVFYELPAYISAFDMT